MIYSWPVTGFFRIGFEQYGKKHDQAVQAQAHDCGEIIWVGMLEKNSQGLQKHGRSGDENHTGIKKAPILRLGLNIGAGTKSRTRDLLITSQLLYQLSYTGNRGAHYAAIQGCWQAF